MQFDYIVKTDGHYGYKIFTNISQAIEFCDKQTAPARIFEVITQEIYCNKES
jgi:hypothetical protein